MKWIKRLAVAVLALATVLIAGVLGTARRTERPVGLQVIQVTTPGGPFAVAIWYPTTDTPRPTTFIGGDLLSVARNGPVKGSGLPLVVISHGNDGSALSHVDLAMDLASAGYVVAAPTHRGDNFADQSRQSSAALFSERAEHMRDTIDYVLKAWRHRATVDPSRVGAFGFSAGAFDVLTLAGGTPNMSLIRDHCVRTPEFACKLLVHTGSSLARSPEGVGIFKADERIQAAVIAAPGFGFTFAGGLSKVDIPIQMWNGDKDDTVPYATNGLIIQRALGARIEARTLDGAAHLSFLAPCSFLKPPVLCRDPAGFDRVAAHAAMNAQVVRFFNSQLPVHASVP